MSDWQYVRIERDDELAIVYIDREEKLNALNAEVFTQLRQAFDSLRYEDDVLGVMVTGVGDKAFAAGADIKRMAEATPVMMMNDPFLDYFDRIGQIGKPVIAAVSGYALGGGCELAMACDMIVASESAKFGQPEINLGVIPGAGGTQRLTKAVGKALAMEIILNGRFLSAEEAMTYGLVNKVAPVEGYLDDAGSRAEKFIRLVFRGGDLLVVIGNVQTATL